jgi:hypothetical protein
LANGGGIALLGRRRRADKDREALPGWRWCADECQAALLGGRWWVNEGRRDCDLKVRKGEKPYAARKDSSEEGATRGSP